MGTKFVKTLQEMNAENMFFAREVKKANSRILRRMALVNQKVSKDIIEKPLTAARGGAPINYQGTLLSMMELRMLSQFNIQFISSAPHSFIVEKGISPKGQALRLRSGKTIPGNWITFSENPNLKIWVNTKLVRFDPDKAEFFNRVGAVKVGDNGFPFTFNQGARFMETGFNIAVINSNAIVSSELSKIA